MTTIFLFDIDQTLLRADGLARRTMERVFLELHGVPDAFASVDFAGRTDHAILRDCFALHRPELHELADEFTRFRELYLPYLDADLMAAGGCTVLPGVVPLLDALGRRGDVVLGLGTGNFRAAAALKLGSVGLWERFVDGGFADDTEDRAAMIAAGLQRLRSGRNDAGEVWVVGDSPHDISGARANGLRVVAVATGRFSLDLLRALEPDAAFADLSDTDAFLTATLGELAR
jgi:phosphoglycolate phosphatase